MEVGLGLFVYAVIVAIIMALAMHIYIVRERKFEERDKQFKAQVEKNST